MPSRNESFPSVAQAAALLVVGFFLQYFVGAALYDARRLLGLSTNELNALVMLIANGALLSFVAHYRGMTYRDLIHPSRSSILTTLVLLVPPVILLVPAILLLDEALIAGLELVFPLSLWEEQAFSNMVAGNLAAALSTCLLAPVLEEMLFRGVLLRAFLVQHPRWAAISYSALFFGAAHFNIYQFALAFLLGLLLGWLFERWRSLLPCIALHAALNSWIVATEAAGDGAAKHSLEQSSPVTWLLALLAAGVGAFLLNRLLSLSQASGSANVT